jgi:hypothetical protein
MDAFLIAASPSKLVRDQLIQSASSDAPLPALFARSNPADSHSALPEMAEWARFSIIF